MLDMCNVALVILLCLYSADLLYAVINHKIKVGAILKVDMQSNNT